MNRKRMIVTSALLSTAIVAALSPCPSSAKVRLRYMHWGANAALQETLVEFNKTHPDIQVDYVPVDWGTYFQKLSVMFASGKPPDMFSILPDDYVDMAQRGLLFDLTPYYRSSKASIKLDDFYPQILDQLSIGGRYYGISYGWLNNGFLAYNIDWFNRVGISVPNDDWDGDALLEVGQKLTKDSDGDGKVDVWGLGGFATNGFSPDPIYSAGESLFDKSGTKIALNDANSIRALSWFVDLTTKHKVTAPDGWGGYLKSKCAILHTHVPGVVERAWQVKGQFKVGVALYPMDNVTRQRKFLIDVGTISVAKSAKHPKECWTFLSWMNTKGYPIAARRTFGISQLVPPLKSIATSDLFLRPESSFPKTADPAVFLKGVKYSTTRPRVKRLPLVLTALGEDWPKVLQGKITIPQWISMVTPKANEILRRK